MNLGDSAEIKRCVNAQDVIDYTALSNHTIADDRVPEPLIGALFSYLLGVRLPGRGANYLKQNTRFHQAARIGDALTARVEITRVRPEKQLVDLSTARVPMDNSSQAGGR